jgi:hypothetical protein
VKKNRTPSAVVDHDNDTVTIAVTFNWRRPWALDHCETGVLVGDLHRLLVRHYGDPEWDQLAGLESVLCYEPNEERLCGSSFRPVLFDREST